MLTTHGLHKVGRCLKFFSPNLSDTTRLKTMIYFVFNMTKQNCVQYFSVIFVQTIGDRLSPCYVYHYMGICPSLYTCWVSISKYMYYQVLYPKRYLCILYCKHTCTSELCAQVYSTNTLVVSSFHIWSFRRWRICIDTNFCH